jgi:hypothetical protein
MRAEQTRFLAIIYENNYRVTRRRHRFQSARDLNYSGDSRAIVGSSRACRYGVIVRGQQHGSASLDSIQPREDIFYGRAGSEVVTRKTTLHFRLITELG